MDGVLVRLPRWQCAQCSVRTFLNKDTLTTSGRQLLCGRSREAMGHQRLLDAQHLRARPESKEATCTSCNRKRQPCSSHSLLGRSWTAPGHASGRWSCLARRRCRRCRVSTGSTPDGTKGGGASTTGLGHTHTHTHSRQEFRYLLCKPTHQRKLGQILGSCDWHHRQHVEPPRRALHQTACILQSRTRQCSFWPHR